LCCLCLLALPTKARIWCLRFIIEYSSLRDFGPYLIGLFLYEYFWKMIFWRMLKPEISYRVIISWRILVPLRGFFEEEYIFCMVKYLSFHNSCFALIYFFNVNGKATVWHTPYSFSIFNWFKSFMGDWQIIVQISMSTQLSQVLQIIYMVILDGLYIGYGWSLFTKLCF
jgi:hypothetical protein